MARIKVKGEQDMIAVPQSDALKVREGIKDGTILPDHYVQMGRFYGPVKNIVSFVLDDEGPRYPVDHNMEDYVKARDEMLALPDNERVKKQSNLYDLTCSVFGYKPSVGQEQKDIEKTREFIKSHPFRMWMDPTIWVKGWSVKGTAQSAHHNSAAEMLGRMVAVDSAHEFDKIQQDESLTKDQ